MFFVFFLLFNLNKIKGAFYIRSYYLLGLSTAYYKLCRPLLIHLGIFNLPNNGIGIRNNNYIQEQFSNATPYVIIIFEDNLG